MGKKKPHANNIDETKNYETFSVIFFNTKADNVAERIAEDCKQGDYIQITGIVAKNKPSPDKPEEMQIVGWNYKKVIWSSEKKKYVYEDNPNEIIGYGKIDINKKVA